MAATVYHVRSLTVLELIKVNSVLSAYVEIDLCLSLAHIETIVN